MIRARSGNNAASDTVDLYVKAYWHDWDTEFTEIYNDIGPGGVLTGTQSVVSDHLFWGFEDYGVTAGEASEVIHVSVRVVASDTASEPDGFTHAKVIAKRGFDIAPRELRIASLHVREQTLFGG